MVGKEENDERRVGLPSLPGTCALVPRFSKRLENVVGKLSVLSAQAGFRVLGLRAWSLVLATLPLAGAATQHEAVGVMTVSVTLTHKRQGLVDG
jgi:hypothetical protein